MSARSVSGCMEHRRRASVSTGTRSGWWCAAGRPPDLRLRLVRLPAYSPDFNPDEAIWGWIRDEVTANTCFGTKAKVQQHVGQFFRDIARRTDEVKRRCRPTLQAQADKLAPFLDAILHQPDHVDPTVALV